MSPISTAAPLLALTLMAAGCASAPTMPTEQAAAEPKVTCEREYRVGSNIPTRDCRAGMTEAERQRMQDDMRNAVRATPSSKGPGG